MKKKAADGVLCRISGLEVLSPGEKKHILGPVDLLISRGERILITGNNGSGKTTFIRALLNLLPEDGSLLAQGDIKWFTEGTPAVVLQDPTSQAIMPTVADELAFVLENQHVETDKMDDKISTVLASVGLTGMEQRSVGTLSGGESQRLSIACALLASAEILVLDEPFSQLDAENSTSLLDTIHHVINANPDITLLLIEHLPGPWVSLINRRLDIDKTGRINDLEEGDISDIADLWISQPAGQGTRGWNNTSVAPPRVTPGYKKGEQRLTVPPIRDSAPPLLITEALSIGRPAKKSWGGGYTSIRSEQVLARDVELKLREGESLLLTGRNGSGKTTLLWTLAGALPPLSGGARVFGFDLNKRRERKRLWRKELVRLVLQEAGKNFLKPTLREELNALHCPIEEVRAPLETAGLDDLLDRSPYTLSVGQMKFFALLGACKTALPALLLLDEPTAALDHKLVPIALEMIASVKNRGAAVIIATHDRRLIEHRDLFTYHLPLG